MSYIYAGSSYPTALAATAQSIADYATACGSDPRGGLLFLDAAPSAQDVLRAMRNDQWELPYIDECCGGIERAVNEAKRSMGASLHR